MEDVSIIIDDWDTMDNWITAELCDRVSTVDEVAWRGKWIQLITVQQGNKNDEGW